MDMMRHEPGTVGGGISIVIIFITLCISMYSLLAVLSAGGELELNRKNRDAAEEYYAADAAAAEIISEVAAAAAGGTYIYESGGISVSWDEGTALFTVPAGGFRELRVLLRLAKDTGRVTVESYRAESSIGWQESAGGTIGVITDFSD